jgi:hypothetical protein
LLSSVSSGFFDGGAGSPMHSVHTAVWSCIVRREAYLS